MSRTTEELTNFAREFREALLKCDKNQLFVTLQTFPNGACGDASYLLAKYLEENGCGQFDYVLGERRPDFQSHAWLEKDGQIIDITADQFDGVTEGILVTTDHKWHDQFEEEDRHIANFEIYDDATVSNLRSSYELVLSKIET